jgi:hypothetical protein
VGNLHEAFVASAWDRLSVTSNLLELFRGLLPPRFRRVPNQGAPAAQVAPVLLKAARGDADEVYRLFQTRHGGLTEREALWRRQVHGPNTVVVEARYRRLKLLGSC